MFVKQKQEQIIKPRRTSDCVIKKPIERHKTTIKKHNQKTRTTKITLT